jgi:hypothetical protein
MEMFKHLFPQPAEPKADPTALQRLQSTFRSADYHIAQAKMRTRIMGAPKPSLTPAQVKALENAERDYRIASIGAPKREDVRFDGIPISPGLPPKLPALGLDWAFRIGREPDRFIQKSLAKQTLTAIMDRSHPASVPYFDATHPAHADTVANVFSVREILNQD